jgi:hypothetical protein
MRTPSSLPDPLPRGPFLVRDALDLGVSRGRLRAPDLARPLWGVRHLGPERSQFLEVLDAAATLVDAEEAFCRETAARLLGLPLPSSWQRDEAVHVCGPTDMPRLRRRGIVPHRGLERRATVTVAGRRCTDDVTTWADLAADLDGAPGLDVDDLVVLGDAIVHWRRGLPVQELRTMTESRSRHRGVRLLREALPLIRTGSDSPMETRTRLLFVRSGLPEPALNAAVTDDLGEWLGTGDFVWKRQRVVAEFDGDYHRTDRRRWQIDVGRREVIQDHGWHYVQLTAESVTRPLSRRRTLERLAGLLDVVLPD